MREFSFYLEGNFKKLLKKNLQERMLKAKKKKKSTNDKNSGSMLLDINHS